MDQVINTKPSPSNSIKDSLLTATHSMISVYFGSITIVLKFPFTSAASAKGLHRYKGFEPGLPGEGGREGGPPEFRGALLPPDGVGERRARGPRLRLENISCEWQRMPANEKAKRDTDAKSQNGKKEEYLT